MISIILPTVPGRENDLAYTRDVYESVYPAAVFEIIVVTGYGNCGEAWNEGAAQASGEYLHFGADDLYPEHPEWAVAGVEACEQGLLVVGPVREAGSVFGCDFARVPFLRAEWWRPLPALHYFSDNLVTAWCARQGIDTISDERFAFFHKRSVPGRISEEGAMFEADRQTYLQHA